MNNPILSKTSNWIYPSTCLHCRQSCEQQHLFCLGCQPLFELIDTSHRCPRCFKERGGKVCVHCRKQDISQAACLHATPPVHTLLKKLPDRDYLAKTIAAWMQLQLHALHWPAFDVVIPLPQPHLFGWVSSPNDAVARCLKLPVCKALGSHREGHYYLRKSVENQRVLLIDLTLSRLRRAARVLRNGYPARMYGLALIEQRL